MDDARTLWCGNLPSQISEELLYELFLQAAPLEKIRIPTDREGRKPNFAFITLKHEISVPYVVQLLNGTRLFDKCIVVKTRNVQNKPNERNAPLQIVPNQSVQLMELLRRSQIYVDNRHGQGQRNHNYRDHERPRDNHKPYNRNDSPDFRRPDHNDRRGNFSDRKNQRNSHRYY